MTDEIVVDETSPTGSVSTEEDSDYPPRRNPTRTRKLKSARRRFSRARRSTSSRLSAAELPKLEIDIDQDIIADKQGDGDIATIETPLTASTALQKPREERSFKEFFPNLAPELPITVVRTNNINTMSASASDGNLLDGEGLKKISLLHTLSSLVSGIVGRVSKRTSAETPSSDIDIQSEQELDDLDKDLAGPVLSSKYPTDIPKVSFQDHKCKGLLYEGCQFKRPEQHYIRYIEPTEEQLKGTCEYDMDEQDYCWLRLINRERRSEDLPDVSEPLFERLIDQLEKEWFHLTKEIMTESQQHVTHEESECCICHDGEVDNSNAIVFCDGCNIAVHQECYGIPYIPEGQWLCRKCLLQPEKQVNCIFCPNTDGAFKQTNTNKWAHLLCALWIPEVHVSNPVYMEPIEGIEKVPKSRWKLLCSICKKRGGACIQCSKTSCFCAYHVTCARKAGLFMKVKHTKIDNEEHTIYKSFCLRHSPNALLGKNLGSTDSVVSIVSNKAEDKSSKIISQHCPVVPELIVKRLMDYLDEEKVNLRQRLKFLHLLCRYWALKRKSRRGAPLLKRLHIEPWTMFSSSIRKNESIQLMRYKILDNLRDDLETVRTLVDLTKKREREKLKAVRAQMDILYMTIAPLNCLLRRALEEFKKMDKQQFFHFPVSAEEVPDYYEIVKNPVSFESIQKRLELFEYDSIQEFRSDIELIVSNCLLYNKPDTIYAKQALKISESIPRVLQMVQESYQRLSISGNPV